MCLYILRQGNARYCNVASDAVDELVMRRLKQFDVCERARNQLPDDADDAAITSRRRRHYWNRLRDGRARHVIPPAGPARSLPSADRQAKLFSVKTDCTTSGSY